MESCCQEKKKLSPRDDEEKQKITNRLSRIEGQISGVKNMIKEDRDCDDVLIQLSAINNAVKSLANVILKSHLNSCVKEKIKNDDAEVMDEIVELFKRFQ